MRTFLVRAVAVWFAATFVAIAGASVALDSVADDVTVRRPAPITRTEVGRRLQERTRATTRATIVDESPGSTARYGEPPASTGGEGGSGGPATTPSTIHRQQGDGTGLTTPATPSTSTSTSTPTSTSSPLNGQPDTTARGGESGDEGIGSSRAP